MPEAHYHVISHTHWDREWYEPFEVFRVRLVRMIDHLLDTVEKEPTYRFHLDAQTVVLGDYLAIKPGNRERLERAIRRGAILIGPWYVQNDFFLTCGESTIRNLLLGRKITAEFGGVPATVGYAPDHFGNISQLPQLLRGFGMKAVIFGRGRDRQSPKSEFIWEGADGTRLIATQMMQFYNNAQRFSEDPERARKFFELARKNLASTVTGGCFLLMNGVDHLDAQENLLPILEKLNAALPRGERIFQSTMAEYIDEVEKKLDNPELIRGELRSGPERLLSIGTLSSRIGQKILNDRCENRLFLELEPLGAQLRLLGFQPECVERHFLDYLWRLLVENHPHDSICGCSQDAVHRHIDDRFERFNEVADLLIADQLRLLGSHVVTGGSAADYYLLVVNTLPFAREVCCRGVIDFAAEESIRTFRLLESDGSEVPFAILSDTITERALRSPINLPGRKLVRRVEVLFTTSLPPGGYKTLLVRPNEAPQELPPLDFENKFLKLEVGEDGKVDILDKNSGRWFRDVLEIIDTGDFGDAYSYRPYPGTEVVRSGNFRPRLTVVRNDALESVLRLDFRLPVPLEANRKTQRRSRRHKLLPVAMVLRLAGNSRRLEVELSGENTCRDHFLRLLVKSGIATDSVVAGGVFDLHRRSRKDPETASRSDREQPVRNFIKLQTAEQGGLTILTGGLHSFEHCDPEIAGDGAIALGILRANGYIMGYFDTPLDATWIVPGNQQPGPFAARIALLPGKYTDDCATEIVAAQDFNVPPLLSSDSCDPRKFSGGRPCVQESELAEIFTRPDPDAALKLPPLASLYSISGAVEFSALKPAENGDSLIMRVCNPDHSDVDFGMALNGAAGTPSPVTIAEADDVSATQVPSRLEAGRILTVKIPMLEVSSTLSNRIPETKENNK